MPTRTSKTGSELFIVDNSDTDWKVRKYPHDSNIGDRHLFQRRIIGDGPKF